MATQAERIAHRTEALDRHEAKLRAEFDAVAVRDQQIRDGIPLGQPILVGHHSERRHRADIERMHRNAHKMAELHAEIRDVAAVQPSTAIMDGDSDAVDLLRAQIAEAEALRAKVKAAPHEAYVLTNLGANILRMRKRLAWLEAAKAKPSTERMVGDVRVVEDTEAMRLRLYFPGKPAPDILARLKGDGWRWSPSEGAWQQNLSNRARWLASRLFPAEAA